MSNCRPSDASDLLTAAVALDLDDLRRFLDALAGSHAVQAAGYRISERQPRRKLYTQRDARILELSERGLSAGQIAQRFDMSRDATLKVLQRSKKMCGQQSIVHRVAFAVLRSIDGRRIAR